MHACVSVCMCTRMCTHAGGDQGTSTGVVLQMASSQLGLVFKAESLP